jgi:hypothetical protein
MGRELHTSHPRRLHGLVDRIGKTGASSKMGPSYGLFWTPPPESPPSRHPMHQKCKQCSTRSCLPQSHL